MLKTIQGKNRLRLTGYIGVAAFRLLHNKENIKEELALMPDNGKYLLYFNSVIKFIQHHCFLL